MKKVLSPTKTPTESPPPITKDEDLMDDLFAQLESKNEVAQQQSAEILQGAGIGSVANDLETSKKDSKSRFKARQARKAAALAEQYAPSDADADAKLEREAREEERIITQTCDELGVKMFEINPDGHCLFSAVADQLSILGVVPSAGVSYVLTRNAASEYLHAHPDDFLPFLPSASGEDGTGATSDGLMSPKEYEQYCVNIRDTAVWGGEPEIMALARAYNVSIHVVQGGIPHIVVHNPSSKPPAETVPIVRISYHRRMYGLGEHYNSLRPKAKSFTDGIKAIFHHNHSPSSSSTSL